MGDSLSVCCFPLLRAAAQAPQDLLVEGVHPPQGLEAREMPTWEEVCRPLGDVLPHIPALTSRSNHPLSFRFPEQVFTLVYFHVEEYTSARALLECQGRFKIDHFGRFKIDPPLLRRKRVLPWVSPAEG